ncbi:hypothetical protein BGZ61DRAFT_466808 [Ilyonectria robusta]|uniref:uncharacterized protein n=1 Tax=Ilyonectria robusta TaxID=1079257 RepID=UPI001E8ECCAE|nr:uncharacterized protein BGZ61DRAFT_466808 [Ilyonectria robusta]KAH8656310.1 hypothetical protein BGZ61DRAFT_466808 [Ilyonectria robusta]
MLTLLPDNFVLEEVTTNDLIIASLAWGFTLGIGWLTAWSAIQQTASAYRRRGFALLRNPYIWMIWGEISVCLGFGIICFMYILGVVMPSFAFYFCILTLWALQVQFLLQIIVNRCAILLHDQTFVWRVKYGVAAFITAINISVYCIWIPARLQISESYIHINEIWDRCEKIIYLLVDACLNFLFIRIVRSNLVELGLSKYDNLVKFNMFIIVFSLSMDVLIVSMMSLKNTFVYMQFHPLAYIVKLNIEMSMASLIAKIARQSGHSHGSDYNTNTGTRSRATRAGDNTLANKTQDGGERPKSKAWPTVTTTVEMHVMDAKGAPATKATRGFSHADTDMLLDEAPYSVQIQGAYAESSQVSRLGAEGSVSSRGSGLDPVP